MTDTPVIQRTIKKISKRLLPFLLAMYILSFLYRSNLGFAKASFQLDTGLSDAMFAFGAGIFFLGYSIFEIPSNLIMHRVGAKRWMFRIMVSWGIISSLMMFAHNERSFYILRFLLGAAEAGFFPEFNGSMGLHGWQWMFVIEGLVAAVFGVWAYWYLDRLLPFNRYSGHFPQVIFREPLRREGLLSLIQ